MRRRRSHSTAMLFSSGPRWANRDHPHFADAGPSSCADENHEGTIMRLSARNQIKCTVVEVTKGATTSHIRVDIGGNVMTSSITNEAVDDLGIKVGGKVIVVV